MDSVVTRSAGLYSEGQGPPKTLPVGLATVFLIASPHNDETHQPETGVVWADGKPPVPICSLPLGRTVQVFGENSVSGQRL